MSEKNTFKLPPFENVFQAFPPLQVFEIFPDLAIGSAGFGGSATPLQPSPDRAPKSNEAPIAPDQPVQPTSVSISDTRPQSTPSRRTPVDERTSNLGKRALSTAMGEVGVKEQPKGSNRGPRVDQYQDAQGQYWCCHFVSWCVEQNDKSPFGHKGWVEGLRRWAKSNGKYIPAQGASPRIGDIFTMSRYDKAGKAVGGHTGFVESVSNDGRTVATIEGNVSDQVARKRRSIASLDGFVRL